MCHRLLFHVEKGRKNTQTQSTLPKKPLLDGNIERSRTNSRFRYTYAAAHWTELNDLLGVFFLTSLITSNHGYHLIFAKKLSSQLAVFWYV